MALPQMTSEEETEIRAVLVLQQQIDELKWEVSARLAPFKAKDMRFFVIGGDEIWRMTRWDERTMGPVTKEMFSAWCLEKVGKSA